MAIDVDKLLSDVSPDEPCGPDLSYDAEYMALFREAEGTRGQSMGDAVIEGVEPNWRDVIASANTVLGRTKDLNVALLLTAASLAQDGIAGLRDGMKLLMGLCERHWDHFHPQLDPDDDNDPLERMNLVAALAAPLGQDGDVMQFRRRLREASLASSRQLGRYGLRHVLMASGAVSPPAGETAPDRSLIDAAFADTDPDELMKTAEAAREAAAVSKKFDDWLTSKVGAGHACDLKPWHDALREVTSLLDEQVASRGLGEGAGGDADAAAADAAAPQAAGAARATGPAVGGAPGTIASRDDVIATLGKLLEYYKRAEPSSPVPLLLHRARRLASMSFVDIIRDLSPDAMNQIRLVGGADAIEDSASTGETPSAPQGGTPAPSAPQGDKPAPVRLT